MKFGTKLEFIAIPRRCLYIPKRHDKNVLEFEIRQGAGGNVSITTSDVKSIKSMQSRSRANFQEETSEHRFSSSEQYQITRRI